MTVVDEEAEAMREINCSDGIRAILSIDTHNAPMAAAKQIDSGNGNCSHVLYNPVLYILSCTFDVKTKVWDL